MAQNGSHQQCETVFVVTEVLQHVVSVLPSGQDGSKGRRELLQGEEKDQHI